MANEQIVWHPLRQHILGELHARPYMPITTPRAVLQQAFLCKPSSCAQADIDVFARWCIKNKVKPPAANSRHHMVLLGDVHLTWERHTEFITLTWDCPYSKAAQGRLWAFSRQNLDHMLAHKLKLISAARINLIKATNTKPDLRDFHADSTCMSSLNKDQALVITDFRQDEFGASKFTVINRSLDAKNCGILVRRLLEVETYKVMSLYGFERIKTVLPKISSLEEQLVSLTGQINKKSDLAMTRKILDEITDIAAELANLSAASQYRFSATQAYYNIVKARLKRIDEQEIANYSKIEEFLNKRLAPAMRTCANIEKRIQTAGDKLDRSTGLLRTKVEIQMQAQSHDVLASMNKRAHMQYRLQTTVEGLSIAAVSYYVVGLLSYIAKGVGIDTYIDPAKLTALFVPASVFAVWMIVRNVRRKH